jgi:hypothetical protein
MSVPGVGPIISSAMVAAIGAGEAFSKGRDFAVVGVDFESWKAYKVEVAGNECNGCHRLGVNNILSGMGTALDFAIRSTAAQEESKNPPSAASPIWMPPIPVQTVFNQAHADAAKAIHDCALRVHEDPLPSSAECTITQFAGAWVPPPANVLAITLQYLLQPPGAPGAILQYLLQ